jgi:flagellar protein FliL
MRPAVRNALIALFSERDYEALLTRAGKEALRQEALEVVRAELTMLTGQPQAEDIYFTSFVMQ